MREAKDMQPADNGMMPRAVDSAVERLLRSDRRARNIRIAMFGSIMISDVSWRIIQALFPSIEEKASLRTKELSILAGIPNSTLIRHLDHLEEIGFVNRLIDIDDNRVTLISLSEKGQDLVRHYYLKLLECGDAT